MKRLIIEIRDDVCSWQMALYYARHVIHGGRISGEGGKAQYCYFTQFSNDVGCSAFKNKASDRLVLHRAPTPER